MLINQGDIYWVPQEAPNGSGPGIAHPQVIIQRNDLNQTVVVCALTTNLKRARLPGNVLLEAGEARLPKQSVVEVSKVSTIAKTQLGEFIGSLSEGRVQQIFAGIQFLQYMIDQRDRGS